MAKQRGPKGKAQHSVRKIKKTIKKNKKFKAPKRNKR